MLAVLVLGKIRPRTVENLVVDNVKAARRYLHLVEAVVDYADKRLPQKFHVALLAVRKLRRLTDKPYLPAREKHGLSCAVGNIVPVVVGVEGVKLLVGRVAETAHNVRYALECVVRHGGVVVGGNTEGTVNGGFEPCDAALVEHLAEGLAAVGNAHGQRRHGDNDYPVLLGADPYHRKIAENVFVVHAGVQRVVRVDITARNVGAAAVIVGYLVNDDLSENAENSAEYDKRYKENERDRSLRARSFFALPIVIAR